MMEWLVNNGIQVATLVTLAVVIAKVNRWVGIMETRVAGLEEWKKQHIQFTHGGTP